MVEAIAIVVSLFGRLYSECLFYFGEFGGLLKNSV